MQPNDKPVGPGMSNPSQQHRRRDVVDAVACSRCQDRGYLRAEVPFGHPLFGKALECDCKKVQKKEAQRQILRKQSNLDSLPAFQEESFSTFQFRLPGVLEAYEAAKAFAQTPQGWLILQGPNGCGKTHLAVAIAKACLDTRGTVLFAMVPELLESLRATFSDTAKTAYEDEFKKMREAEVLILDDLGSESSTPWAMEKLFLLFNYRYNARLATVVTTNMVNLEGIAPRLRSRLRDRRLARSVVMEARDFREREI